MTKFSGAEIKLSEWKIAIATPGLEAADLTKLNLDNGEGVLLTPV
ncbi:MAG: hypothetical protein AAFO95_21315 [Cyanobacteria bacterium J06600_6]